MTIQKDAEAAAPETQLHEELRGTRFDPTKRHDFALLVDFTYSNPNGDPDADNDPRTDHETGHGLISPVSTKRKMRDYLTLVGVDIKEEDFAGEPGKWYSGPGRDNEDGIFVEHACILNDKIASAHSAANLLDPEPGTSKVTDKEAMDFLTRLEQSGSLPEGFGLQEKEGSGARSVTLTYTGTATTQGAAALFHEAEGRNAPNKAIAAVTEAVDGSRAEIKTAAARARATEECCRRYFDARMVGAVLSTGNRKADPVRGPLSIGWGVSLDAVNPRDDRISRCARASYDDARENKTFGDLNHIPYGLYMICGSYNPYLAEKTGVSARDMYMLWEALGGMWHFSQTASKPSIHRAEMTVFTHSRRRGDAPAQKLQNMLWAEKKEGVTYPRRLEDYEVHTPAASDMPAGVKLTTFERD